MKDRLYPWWGGPRRDTVSRRREVDWRRRCRRLLRELGVTPPLEVEELGRLFGEHRARPILFVGYEIPVPGPFAVTYAEPGADVVLYQADASRPHQQHIKAHEIGHMIAGHSPEEINTTHLFRRTEYDTDREWEAETIATIILEWAMVFDALPGSGSSSSGVGARVGKAVTLHRRGWL